MTRNQPSGFLSMNKPLLYEPFDTDGVAHDMRQDNGGNWVRAEDYWVLSAENSRLREALLEVHRDIWLTLEWAGLDAQAYKGSVSTEPAPVSPKTAIEKDNQKRDGDRQK